jgi:hypothetical protein
MIHCACCRSLFDEPDVVRRRENLDGERGYIIVAEKFCPVCGAEDIYFEDVKENGREWQSIRFQQRA